MSQYVHPQHRGVHGQGPAVVGDDDGSPGRGDVFAALRVDTKPALVEERSQPLGAAHPIGIGPENVVAVTGVVDRRNVSPLDFFGS